jgi:hypothetical protein
MGKRATKQPATSSKKIKSKIKRRVRREVIKENILRFNNPELEREITAAGIIRQKEKGIKKKMKRARKRAEAYRKQMFLNTGKTLPDPAVQLIVEMLAGKKK